MEKDLNYKQLLKEFFDQFPSCLCIYYSVDFKQRTDYWRATISMYMLTDDTFVGFGDTKKEAENAAAYNAYHYIKTYSQDSQKIVQELIHLHQEIARMNRRVVKLKKKLLL